MVGVDQVIDEVVVDPPYGSGTFILVVDEPENGLEILVKTPKF